jgi:hypothetical protein
VARATNDGGSDYGSAEHGYTKQSNIMSVRVTITEAQAEIIADIAIIRRLDTDCAYNHAEDDESQQEREDEIGRQVWKNIEDRYEIA